MEQLEIVEGLIQEKPQVSPVSPADYVTKTEGSKYYGDALNDTNINELVGDEIPHVVILVGFLSMVNQHLLHPSTTKY